MKKDFKSILQTILTRLNALEHQDEVTMAIEKVLVN